MSKRQSFWIIFGGLSVVAVIALGLLTYYAGSILDYLCERRQNIATLDVRNQRRIVLTVDVCFENDSRPIYYEVREANRVVTPTTYVGNDNGVESHTYTTFYAERESLVAVLETSATPAQIVIMQDFNSGESWPRLRDDEMPTQEFVKQKWQRIFERLRLENPQLPKPEYLNP